MWLFLWALFIASVYSRPQVYQFDQSRPNVELSKQDILHVTFNASIRDEAAQRRIEENTREILEKIEALNKKHGLTKKKKPSYLHFPFSYSRSQENSENDHYKPSGSNEKMALQERSSSPVANSKNIFKFPTNPFQNPIFQYLEEQQNLPAQFKSSTVHSPNGYIGISQTNPSAQITEEDKIPGEFIQRKITHQQTMIIPSIQTYMDNQYNAKVPLSMQNIQRYEYPIPPAMISQFITKRPEANQQQTTRIQNNRVGTLEKQTVNNIKNIIWNSQSPTLSFYPYMSNVEPNYQSSYLVPQMSNYGNIEAGQNQSPAILYGPFIVPNLGSALSRQFQSPLQNYFPMVIKDPLVQLFNAFTTMIEYGPQAASSSSACKTKSNEKLGENSQTAEEHNIKEETQSELSNFDKQQTEIEQHTYDTDSNNALKSSNSTIKHNDTLVVEDTEFYEQANGSVTNIRSPKGKTQETLFLINKKSDTENNLKLASKTSNFNMKENHVRQTRPYIKINQKPFTDEATSTVKIELAENFLRRGSTPIRKDQIFIENNEENEKRFGLGNNKPSYTSGEDTQVSHDGNKKLFSKDNTGSGIFIHKLKVRRGGVAIAGPGGIATAGEGGTAIVGPNGYAYTQPDSLAIAGTGTKVIAVEPTVNLSELVKKNKTRLGGAYPQRFGKIVAVGPVIYYNKG